MKPGVALLLVLALLALAQTMDYYMLPEVQARSAKEVK
jgi:hypothetical protein